MVLASPPRPPVDPDDVNALSRKYSTDLFQVLYEGRYTPSPPPPRGTLLFKCDAIRALEQLRSQPNDTCIPQIFQIQYLLK